LQLNSREELCKNIFYSKFYNLLNEMSTLINSLNEQEQRIKNVSLVLSNMWDMRTNMAIEEIEILDKLFRDRIYNSLSSEDKKYYNKGYDIIANWKDYFLSYTRRDLPTTNNDFEKLVKHCLQSHELGNIDKDHRLVKVIMKCLKNNNLDGFFDLNDIKNGEDIAEEIYKYCNSSFSFVQVIERPSFVRPVEEKNWCHKEYTAFKSNHKNSLSAIGACLIGQSFQFIIPFEWDDTLPAVKPKEYKEWISHCIKLKRLENLYQYNTSSNDFHKEMNKIAQAIVDARDKFMEYFWREA
jgi:hypothetical protein